LQALSTRGLGRDVTEVAEPGLARLLLANVEELRVELSSLARTTAAQGARVEDMQATLRRIDQHVSDCPARGGWTHLREDLSEIRVMVGAHDRLISENTGYRQGKHESRRFKETPKFGLHSFLPGDQGVSFSVSIKDPKVWGKIVFYTLLGIGAGTGATFLLQYL
jgi:hypothetical protein